jgi:DNA-directed RNA polymerase subunit RPC12/RpoP
MPTGFCLKCRKKVELRNPTETVLKNKARAIVGTCPQCGTKVYVITGRAK